MSTRLSASLTKARSQRNAGFVQQVIRLSISAITADFGFPRRVFAQDARRFGIVVVGAKVERGHKGTRKNVGSLQMKQS
eukprot:SAG31_NODE_1014_length_10366_cov_2.357129_7_plen_79_part_00